ncbi:MAG: galactose ABC transporter substrate-binding protein [Lachnospiraceae bacterium]|jgi:methyl-galactoside transport system substrate-binding protein|nr:galactose ABC transporter substrate-binding protein [Lachnospiraceae bacterium]MCI9590619.1 galactose ABC transporter substrate-binding protein [Lachnospiraceae bacterium]
MKKRLLAVAMSGVMAMSLAACGGSNEAAATTAAPAATEAPAGDATEAAETKAAETEAPAAEAVDLDVAVFYYTYSDTYISSVRTALDAALTDAGIKFQNYDSNSNQTTQNEQIDTAISQGANLLIVNIVTSGSVDASQAIVDKASTAGIPVIFFNRAVESDEDEGKVLGSYDKCAFVGTDAPEAGHMQGKMIGEYVLENYDAIDLNGDGTISYAMFMGQLGNVEAIYRTQYGVEDADAALTAAGKPALEYFDASNTDKYQVDQEGNWSATAANNYMNTNLAQYNEDNGNMIEIVICNNDGMAEGVITALNDKGYNLGTEDSVTIPVFGVDATDAAKQLIADGKMTGTIKQDAEGMANGIAYLAKNVGAGKDLMADTGDFNISENVSNKIYIPYATYTGE